MLNRLRLFAAGFTDQEVELYQLKKLPYPDLATNFLSHKDNNRIFRKILNASHQKYILEDKWAAHHFLSGCGFPVPVTYGLYHPELGLAHDGSRFCKQEDFERIFSDSHTIKLVFKPRGGRQGRNLFVAKFFMDDSSKKITVEFNGHRLTLNDFLRQLPVDAYKEYDGGYHGWIVQKYINQHEIISKLYPNTVNTVRLVTFLTLDNQVDYHFAILRLGRDGRPGDNWASGGVSVGIDLDTGMLKNGVLKPKYGGTWVTKHPDTEVKFKDVRLPYWNEMLDLSAKAARQFSGVRSVGWDIAVSQNGPMIVEANAEWDLAMVQAHSATGYLTPKIREELLKFGVQFSDTLPSLSRSLPRVIIRRLMMSRLGKYFKMY